MNGFVQNKIVTFKKKNVMLEKKMTTTKITVWRGFWTGGIIGPFLRGDANERAVTIG